MSGHQDGAEVRSGRSEDVAAAADVLAEAFTGYVWATWTVAADDHTGRLRAQHELFLRRVLVPHGAWWVAEAGEPGPGRLVGVAAWLPPDADVPEAVWADLDGELTGLASRDNVRLYERLGFRISGHVEVPDGGPHLWGMVKVGRPAR